MPTTIRRLEPHGLEPVDYKAETLAQAAQYEPDAGVYTVANTVNTYEVLRLTAHLDRLEDSAQREGINLTLTQAQLRAALRQLIEVAGYGDVRFRITVPKATPNTPILSVEPFTGYPASIYTDGVRVITVANSARHNATAKDTAWMHQREALRAATDAYEVILTDADGRLLEGATSNFYAIVRDTLYTALDGVLAGTSRGIVFEVAPGVLPLVRRPVTQADVPNMREAFISSSSRGVVPVVQVDDTVLGNGKPGPYTLAIREAYLAWTADHLEAI